MFPLLAIVDTASLVLHETVDPRRVKRLIGIVKTAKIFTHPPIVSRLTDQTFVVLDGANRVTAVKNLGLPHLLVQVVDYDRSDIQLQTWNHIVSGFQWKQWGKEIVGALGQAFRIVRSSQKKNNIRPERFCARFTVGKTTHAVIERSGDAANNIERMNAFVQTYKGVYDLSRTNEPLEIIRPRGLKPNEAFVEFPNFKKSDIVHCASRALQIPSGISRHRIPGRALHVDLPMEILKSSQSRIQKQKLLDQHIRERQASGRVRYYEEPVYLFDE